MMDEETAEKNSKKLERFFNNGKKFWVFFYEFEVISVQWKGDYCGDPNSNGKVCPNTKYCLPKLKGFCLPDSMVWYSDTCYLPAVVAD